MLKINSGKFGARIITQPPDKITRPVTQKVRAAIFSTLGDIEDLSVLDLFAGSGALGLEALSNGASNVVFVDKSNKAVDVIRKNINTLRVVEHSKVINKSAETFLQTNTEKYDLIFLDPPYEIFTIEILTEAIKHLNSTGVIIVSCSNKFDFPQNIPGLKQVRNKKYGDTQIVYLLSKNIVKK